MTRESEFVIVCSVPLVIILVPYIITLRAAIKVLKGQVVDKDDPNDLMGAFSLIGAVMGTFVILLLLFAIIFTLTGQLKYVDP